MALLGILAKSKKEDSSTSEKTPSAESLQEIFPAAGVAAIFFLVAFASLFYLNVYTPNQKNTDQQNKLTAQLAASLLSNFLDSHQQQAQSIAQHPFIIEALAKNLTSEQEELEIFLKPALAGETSIHIFPPTVDRASRETSSFAALDLVSRNLNGENTLPEATQVDQKWTLLFARPVKKEGETIGTVILSAPIEPLQKSLEPLTRDGSGLKIFQSSDEEAPPIITSGKITDTPGEDYEVPDLFWRVVYIPSASKAMEGSLPLVVDSSRFCHVFDLWLLQFCILPPSQHLNR